MTLSTETPLLAKIREELKVTAHTICFEPGPSGLIACIKDHNLNHIATAVRQDGEYHFINRVHIISPTKKPDGLK